MSLHVIDIPGESTKFDASPHVEVVSCDGGVRQLTIRYNAREATGGLEPIYGEVTFVSVLEYRWVSQEFYYEDFPEHEADVTFGLVEMLNSKYVDNMARKGVFRNHPDMRLGPGADEKTVRHFRMAFDDYGRFDVIALGVSVLEVAGRRPVAR